MSPNPLATTTTTTTAPSPGCYFQVSPVTQELGRNEYRLRLYAYQNLGKQNSNQKVVADPKLPNAFGCVAVNDWDVYDSASPSARLVALAQGMHAGTGMTKYNWSIWFNLRFQDGRFKGSSLKVIGDFCSEEGEWAIVGGTGEFAFAQGVITFKMAQMAQGNVWELNVHALCLTFSKPSKGENCGDKTDVPNDKPCVQNLVAKIGLFGNAEKKILDITETPQRLESVAIRSGDVVDSLVFSYVDQAGQKHTTDRWGGPRGLESNKIELAPSEFVTEISGTTGTFGGGKVVASLTFVTNVRTYGPFGKAQSAGTPFRVPVQDGCSIVGFFACAGDYIEAIGVYVRANGPK